MKKMLDTVHETWDEHLETYNPGEYLDMKTLYKPSVMKVR